MCFSAAQARYRGLNLLLFYIRFYEIDVKRRGQGRELTQHQVIAINFFCKGGPVQLDGIKRLVSEPPQVVSRSSFIALALKDVARLWPFVERVAAVKRAHSRSHWLLRKGDPTRGAMSVAQGGGKRWRKVSNVYWYLTDMVTRTLARVPPAMALESLQLVMSIPPSRFRRSAQ